MLEGKHNLKYSKRLEDPMTLKELEIWHSQEVEISQNPATFGRRGKTRKETMKELNVGEKAISRTKEKPDYNAATKAMFEQKCGNATEVYVDNIIALTKATKKVTVRVPASEGSEAMVFKRVEEPENTVRFNATCKIGDVLGVDAPKQMDLKHSMAAMSDDELRNELDHSVKEIEKNGRIRNHITGSVDARAIITSNITLEESGVAVGVGQQGACPTDS